MKITAELFKRDLQIIEEITSANGYSYVKTAGMKDEDKILCSTPLREWLLLLNSDSFVQVNRSTIINLAYARLSGDSIILNSGRTIVISRRRCKSCKKAYVAYQIRKKMKHM